MRNRAVVSNRGTVTIPDAIRKMANIRPGDLVEFESQQDNVVLRRLMVKRADEEEFMNDDEWQEFDRLVKKQIASKEYTSYEDLNEAKRHSRRLLK
ncbi:AbrB/MazE/SpoVT family DNA-binding domain-containing protein [bacterium]|nr:AbrB/MazE/SpoVT family DNA-binding domain-containing protein [bacterium]